MARKRQKQRTTDGFYKARNSTRAWESDEWFFRLQIDGKRKPFKAYTDLDVSKKLRRDLITQIERHQEGLPVRLTNCSPLLRQHLERLGITDAVQKQSLAESVAAYKLYLESKDDCEDYIQRTIGRISKINAGCGFERPIDIKPAPIRKFLHELRSSGEIGKTTFNHYLRAYKSFVGFLVNEEEQLESNPVNKLRMLKTDDDIRRRRRPPTRDEFERLLKAAAKRQDRHALPGYSRMVLYALSAYSGLRAQELASLTPMSFDFTAVPPTVTVAATVSKHRKMDVVQIRSDVAQLVADFIKGKPRNKRLWPGRWFRRAAEMLRADCKAAGIEYVDEQGRVLDFHAMRHGYVDTVVGVTDPKTAQAMARHSTVTLTLGCYTHLDQQKIVAALDAMPPLPKFVKGLRRNGMKRRSAG